jgi:peroxiredoxin
MIQQKQNLLAWFLLTLLVGTCVRSEAQNRPVVGKPAPLFTMTDVENKTQALKEQRGKPVVVLFFCPCDYCKPVAKLYAEAQNGGALAKELKENQITAPEHPQTLVVFAGETDLTREFGEVASFDKMQTALLADYKLRTARLYDAIPCPRAFVLDAKGVLRYTNTEAGRHPHKVPATTIVSRLVSAVQLVWAGKTVPMEKSPEKPKPAGKTGKKGTGRAKH